jgi:GNAT superfamily N-acetyltransferase
MYLVEDENGGEFNEVTEEIEGRPILAVMVASRDSYSSNDTFIVVAPDHRNQRIGNRLLRYMLDQMTDQAYGRVNLNDPTAVAFASRYGRFEETYVENGYPWALVRFSYQNPNWRHGGCRCAHCTTELSSLTGTRPWSPDDEG